MIYILLPVFNRKNKTEAFVNCLLKQTEQAFHLVLIDDGSTDGTHEMVRSKFLNRQNQLSIISGPGDWWWAGSLQQGRDWLLDRSLTSDDKVLIINNDTTFDESYLENAVRLLDSKPGCVLGSVCKNDVSGEVIDKGVLVDWSKYSFRVADNPGEVDCLSTRGLFFSFEDFKKVGDFHTLILPHYGSDYEYTIRAKTKGLKLITDSSVVVKEDTTTTGIHDPRQLPFGQFIESYFSLRSVLNPFYLTSFVLLSCPLKWWPRNLSFIWTRAAFHLTRNFVMTLKNPKLWSPVAVLSTILFCLYLHIFWPGLMSTDSISQLQQAITDQYSGWHPPILSKLWHFLLPERFSGGLMLALQLAIYLLTLSMLSVTLFKKRIWQCLFVLLFSLYPTQMTSVGTIWKDTQMSLIYMFISVFALKRLLKGQDISIKSLVLLSPLLIYGSAVRTNAIFAIIPFSFALAFGRKQTKLLKNFLAAVGFALFIWASGSFINKVLTDVESFVVPGLMGFDIAGISVNVNEDLMPKLLRGNCSLEQLKQHYTPTMNMTLLWQNVMHGVENRADAAEVTRIWKDLIFQYPAAYLKHRADVFNELTCKTCYGFHASIDENPYGLKFHVVRLFDNIYHFYREISGSFVFKGWFYVLLNIVILILIQFTEKSNGPLRRFLSFLLISGLAYWAMYFFITPTCDLRYLYWTIDTALLGLIVVTRRVVKA